jgi:hypothetical protein
MVGFSPEGPHFQSLALPQRALPKNSDFLGKMKSLRATSLFFWQELGFADPSDLSHGRID